jgi:DNA-binding response OmpR family regulator
MPQSSQSAHTLALIVEPDNGIRSLYADHLRASGYEVEEADDGREGLVRAISRRPDIVVTETRLLGIDGCDLCALLRRDTATQDIVIIALVGDGSPEDRDRAADAGADAILMKPCLPDRLFAEMQRLLRSSAAPRHHATAGRQDWHRTPAVASGPGDRQSLSGRMLRLSHAHGRYQTADPPRRPPALLCPSCDAPLNYKNSHIGGVSARHSEQWDYYDCVNGCGSFQYRQRTRRLRAVAS